jgi:hypothetical protein
MPLASPHDLAASVSMQFKSERNELRWSEWQPRLRKSKFSATGRPGRGPDNAKHLFIIDGQFDARLATGSQGANFAVAKEAFSVLVGPKLTNRQFVRAIATASFVKTQIANGATGGFETWNVVDVDADWDDGCGKLELRIEAQMSCLGSNQSASISGFAFNDSSGSPRW